MLGLFGEKKKDTPDRGNSAYKEEKYKSVWHDQWEVAFWLPVIHVERTQKSSLPSSQKGGGIGGGARGEDGGRQPINQAKTGPFFLRKIEVIRKAGDRKTQNFSLWA